MATKHAVVPRSHDGSPRRAVTAEAVRRLLTFPSQASSRHENGRGAPPAESARAEARRDAPAGSQEIPSRGSPAPHGALNSAGRLCGSTRLPLGGFTYS